MVWILLGLIVAVVMFVLKILAGVRESDGR